MKRKSFDAVATQRAAEMDDSNGVSEDDNKEQKLPQGNTAMFRSTKVMHEAKSLPLSKLARTVAFKLRRQAKAAMQQIEDDESSGSYCALDAPRCQLCREEKVCDDDDWICLHCCPDNSNYQKSLASLLAQDTPAI